MGDAAAGALLWACATPARPRPALMINKLRNMVDSKANHGIVAQHEKRAAEAAPCADAVNGNAGQRL
jgi:hypothetical protein